MAGTLKARARAVFRGQVQGVGFRYSARRVATAYAVTGYVENEPDGSVELVAEGDRSEVEAFIGAVTREMEAFIRKREVGWEAPTGRFDGFGIRHAW